MDHCKGHRPLKTKQGKKLYLIPQGVREVYIAKDLMRRHSPDDLPSQLYELCVCHRPIKYIGRDQIVTWKWLPKSVSWLRCTLVYREFKENGLDPPYMA